MRRLDAVWGARSLTHNTRREGIRLGLVLATATWLWVALVDVSTGHPFHTFSMLGGVVIFTVAHYALNITYGITLLSAVHGAERAPSLIIAMIFGLVTFEGAFAMFTNILVEYSLGGTGWIAIFGGSLIATALAILLLSRTHPLGARLRQAEEEL